MKFRNSYDDHEHENDLSNAEPFGVICILQQRGHDGKWGIISNCPYYLHDGNEWLPAYENDVIDYLAHSKHIEKLCVGRIVNKKRFSEVYDKAKADRAKMG